MDIQLEKQIRDELRLEYTADGKPSERFVWAYRKLIEARAKLKEIDESQGKTRDPDASDETVVGHPIQLQSYTESNASSG